MNLQARIVAWDAALGAVRAYFRGEALAEVSTPVRVPAVAIEPYIEPIAAGSAWLCTSPELPMKQLLLGGAGPMFQVAHVFRAAERGDRHAEEFHLVEWYRPRCADLGRLQRDTEAVVEGVFAAVGRRAPPAHWQTHGVLDLMARTTGVRLDGTEDALALSEALRRVRPDLVPVSPPNRAREPPPADVATLAAWTSFFSAWCDADLDPWLRTQADGIHVSEFPPALAALSELAAPRCTQGEVPKVAFRVESHVAGVELSNGYRELSCSAEQRRRFETVQGLRRALGAAALPLPEGFLRAMAARTLPPTVGCALGLDRLVMLACGAQRIGDIALPLSWSAERGAL